MSLAELTTHLDHTVMFHCSQKYLQFWGKCCSSPISYGWYTIVHVLPSHVAFIIIWLRKEAIEYEVDWLRIYCISG